MMEEIKNDEIITEVDSSHELFLNNLRKEKTPVTFSLANGKFINGRVYGYDRFTVQVKNYQGIHLIFKSAICNISPQSERNSFNKPKRNMKNK